MPGPRPSALAFEADLTLTVTAPDGRSTSARAVGDGGGLRITTPRPDILFAAVSRDVIGPVADALHAADVSVFVDGPRGQVAVIGSAGSGLLGRLVTGSSHSGVRPSRIVPARLASALGLFAVASLAAATIVRLRRR